MMSSEGRVRELVQEARSALQEALARSHPARAWELLQDRDAEGNAMGALPYTEAALAQLAAAHNHDPEDPNILHHLAIAHHARAWDMELQVDPRAAREWEGALGYWRKIAASSAFWNGMKAKLSSCDPKADTTLLDQVRQNLLESLLDIHVAFVRHYCESGTPERGTDHVQIVRRARIPPAVKRRLVDKVFEALTSGVTQAKVQKTESASASALMIIERFLDLFQNHLPALRMHAEVCKEWVAGLSYKDDWDTIMRIGERAIVHARSLGECPELELDPLARMALEELACEFLLKGGDRGDSLSATSESSLIAVDNRYEARAAYDLAINWGRLAYRRSPADSDFRILFMRSLNSRARSLHEEAAEVMNTEETSLRDRLNTALGLYREAVANMQEALDCQPDSDIIRKNLKVLSENLSALESQRNLFDLFGSLGDQS